MARKRRSKRNRNFQAIPFDLAISLGTLGNGTTIFGDALGSALGEDFYAISADAQFSITGFTSNEGPLSVGYSHDDLSGTEVVECLQAEVTDPDDIIAKERARRPVRRAGSFPCASQGNEVMNDGVPVRTKLKFSIGDGHNLHVWVFNQSGGTLTTGATVNVIGTLYGRWQR